MAQPGWINENINRYFPFQEGEGFFPRTAIADFGCSTGHNAVFDTSQDTVWLGRIDRASGNFYFWFYSDAEGLAGNPLVFTVPITASYSTVYAEILTSDDPFSLSPAATDSLSLSASESTVALDCVDDNLWDGYIVVGDLAELTALVADSTSITGTALVETCLVHSLFQGYVRSLNLANKSRTRWEPDEDCDCAAYRIFSEAAAAHTVYATCLDGAIRLQEGYNCSIVQSIYSNSITISASKSAGDGENCAEVKISPDEELPSGSDYYDGSLGCNDVLRSINGIGGRLFDITSGPGISVEYLPTQHAVRLDINLIGLAACGASGYTVTATDDPEITPCSC